jgi:hypothetical protein
MTLDDLLQAGADDAVALAAPGRKPLDYRALRAVVGTAGASLNAAGIGSIWTTCRRRHWSSSAAALRLRSARRASSASA